MGDVIANMSMSLDGYIENAAGSVEDLFGWYSNGDEAVTMPGDGRVFRTSAATAEHLRQTIAGTGALVTGRRLFDLTQGWGGCHPTGAPVFVVTHRPPVDWTHPEAPFTFVTDGVAAAVEQARAVAGDRIVAVASADIARQCVDLGLLDAITFDLVPVLLGAGKPFFADLQDPPVKLEAPTVVQGEGVTHLCFRTRREA